MNVKDKFRFGYSYDFASIGSNIAGGGAHELHLGIRLASKKVSSHAKNTTGQGGRELANEMPRSKTIDKSALALEHPTPEDKEVHQQRLAETDPALVTSPGSVSKESTPAKNETTPVGKESVAKAPPVKAPTPKPRENFTLSSGTHYVVIGVFRNLSGSMQFVKTMKEKGYSANAALNPKNNFYYVYIHSSTDLDGAKKKRNEYKLKNLFKEAWLFTME
jgi:cell division septation protein DedD